MSRPPLADAVRCAACRTVLAYVKRGERIGRYLVPAPGVPVRLHEDGTGGLTCPRCGATTVHRWPKLAA